MICFRPASIFAQLAGVFKSDIKLRAREKTYMIDAKSIIMIAGFGLTKGTKVEIYAEGMDAKEAVTRLTNLIDSGFDLQDEYIENLVNQGKIKFLKYPLFMYNQNGPLLPILSCWENGSTESNNE